MQCKKKCPSEELFKTRRANLRQLFRAFQNYQAMALELGISEALLQQIIGDNSTRTIDEKQARGFEKRLLIPALSLDSKKLFE